MPQPLHVRFAAGTTGPWQIERAETPIGEPLPHADRLAVLEADAPIPPQAAWVLHGTTSNTRYTTRTELAGLAAKQQGLLRPEATRAAMIPIRKTPAWWDLAQDERRAILEEQSRHIAIGLEYLPAVARRLHHCREFNEPFDFVTWFEYAPEHEPDFEQLLQRLRASEEWRYIDREADLRLRRD